MIKKIIGAALVAAGFMIAPAQAEAVKLGTLTCYIDGGVGLIIGSNRHGECVYTDVNGGREYFHANFSRLGIDVGVTNGKIVVWTVLSVGEPHGSLAGVYTGINAEITAGVGVGANALVGGLDSGIVLNPVSVSGQTGLNVAGGIATLRLE